MSEEDYQLGKENNMTLAKEEAIAEEEEKELHEAICAIHQDKECNC